MTPKEVMAMCRQKDVKAVDLRFVDLFGTPQHLSIPVSKLNEDGFDDGFGFDGRELGGGPAAALGDVLAIPHPDTAFVDPFARLPTLVMFCNLLDSKTRQSSSHDPRALAQRAVNYLRGTGIADQAFFGPEIEFFVFDLAQPTQDGNDASVETRFPLTHRSADVLSVQRPSSSSSALASSDHELLDVRNEMMHLMLECGVDVESQRAGRCARGQAVMALNHGELTSTADAVVTSKYIVKNVAQRDGRTATFMPQPMFGQPGSGMRTHLSLWKDEQPLFAGSGYSGLSELAVHAIGGLLKHADALLAFTNPTTNSYKRLAGPDAPVHRIYSRRCRSCVCRIPTYSSNPRTKRIEFRSPDPSCNPYLAFSAMLMAMVDGVQNKICPQDPVDEDVGDPGWDSRLPATPKTLVGALSELEADHSFLLRGDVFTEEIIEYWISQKQLREVDALMRRPHPHELSMYYDV